MLSDHISRPSPRWSVPNWPFLYLNIMQKWWVHGLEAWRTRLGTDHPAEGLSVWFNTNLMAHKKKIPSPLSHFVFTFSATPLQTWSKNSFSSWKWWDFPNSCHGILLDWVEDWQWEIWWCNASPSFLWAVSSWYWYGKRSNLRAWFAWCLRALLCSFLISTGSCWVTISVDIGWSFVSMSMISNDTSLSHVDQGMFSKLFFSIWVWIG